MKHAKYIYNIQDFNPEQVLAVGYTKNKLVKDKLTKKHEQKHGWAILADKNDKHSCGHLVP